MKLTKPQQRALEHMVNYAKDYETEANAVIKHVLYMSNIKEEDFHESMAKLKRHARIALHFHPDRPDQSMKSVAEALFEQGYYKNQFETYLSNGKLAPDSGGDRDLWEQRLFGGAYQMEGTPGSLRPKYGALNLMRHPDGPAPRFGSCYFLLSPKVSFRSTFTYLDSHQEPKERGTYEAFHMIAAALLEETITREFAIGENNLTPTRLIHHLLYDLEKPFDSPANKTANRNLNHYIEAQVHGDLSLKDDVETLVADPSFKGSPVGQILEQLCLKYSIDLYWHMGFALALEDVPANFRGPAMPSLAKRIATKDYIDTSTIGTAVMNLKSDPSSWRDRGTYDEALQQLKMLWHVLVKYGQPLKCFRNS